jgi:hypothetical protein
VPPTSPPDEEVRAGRQPTGGTHPPSQAHARRSWRPPARSVAAVVAPALLIGVLAWPLLFTDSIFNGDWPIHLWFIWHQSLSIRADHLPSFFLNYSNGVLYPLFAFYGGPVYALAGALSLALGGAPLETYVLTYLMGFAAAFGGWYWMARMAGLGRWRAQVPGLVFITSAYYLTLIYARGDWNEFLGVSAIPLMVAAGLSVLRADRLRPWPAIALVASAVVFFGSHSLTTIWGSVTLVVVGLAILVCVPRARREITRRGVIRVAGLVAPAALVCAWFLLPAAVYESHTIIGAEYPHWRSLLRNSMYLVSTRHLLTLSRATAAEPGTVFALSLPILTIAWVLVGIATFSLTRRRGTWMRILLVVSCATALVGVAMTHAGLILALPRPLAILQFSYRLESYVLLGLSGAVLAVLVLVQGDARTRGVKLLTFALPPIVLVSVVGAVQQVDAHPVTGNRHTALSSFYATPLPGASLIDYVDIHNMAIYGKNPSREPRLAKVIFPPATVYDDRVSRVVHLFPGQLVETNLEGGPDLVKVTGARIVGIAESGDNVLEIERPSGASGRAAARSESGAPTETISVTPTDGLPLVLGRLLALVGAIVLAAEFAVLAARGLRARRA